MIRNHPQFAGIFRTVTRSAVILLLLLQASLQATPDVVEQNWTNYVRIGAYGLQLNNTDKIVADAHAYGKLAVPCRPTRRSRFSGYSSSWG